MKLSPILSKWIRRFILEQGVTKSALFITFISVLLSIVIAKLVASILPGSFGKFNIIIAIVVPFLVAPPLGYIFISLYIELEKVRKEFHALAITDDLTRVFNRRYFLKLAEHELDRAKRYQSAFSIILFDIDNFKQVNDHYGHLCGDVVLRELSLACRTILRPFDAFARFGGEEFILLLPETDDTSALRVANRLCQFVANHVVEYKGEQIQVTVSIGVTTSRVTVDTLEDLLNRADQALYKAKQLGKNRLEIA
jgi:diguanylate cyclase (GGDEF)-like protein